MAREALVPTIRQFRDSAGAWSKGMPEIPVAFKITVEGKDILVEFKTLTKELMLKAAAFGLKTALGNIARSKEEAPFDAVEGLAERFMEGHWTDPDGRGAGPGSGLVIAAIAAAKKKAGIAFDSDAYKAKLSGMDDEARKGCIKHVLSNPHVKLEYEMLKLERAKVRVDGLAEDAATADPNGLAGL